MWTWDLFGSDLNQVVDDGAPWSHQVTHTPYTADLAQTAMDPSTFRQSHLRRHPLVCCEKTCWWDAQAWHRDQTSKADTVSVLISTLALILVRLKFFHPESVRASGVLIALKDTATLCQHTSSSDWSLSCPSRMFWHVENWLLWRRCLECRREAEDTLAESMVQLAPIDPTLCSALHDSANSIGAVRNR